MKDKLCHTLQVFSVRILPDRVTGLPRYTVQKVIFSIKKVWGCTFVDLDQPYIRAFQPAPRRPAFLLPQYSPPARGCTAVAGLPLQRAAAIHGCVCANPDDAFCSTALHATL